MITAVVIPCYNEELTIGKVIDDYKAVLPEAKIYVIDNNCTDRTVDISESKGAFVINEQKQGKGCALRKAFENIEADSYIMVDGDDTYPPSKATVYMNDMILNGEADLVIGDRFESHYFKKNKSLFHGAGNIVVPYLFKKLYNCKVRDIMSGSRVMSRRFVKNFPAASDGFVVETEMMIYALKNGLSVTSVPVEYKERPEGSYSKVNSIKDGTAILKEIFRHRRNDRHNK